MRKGPPIEHGYKNRRRFSFASCFALVFLFCVSKIPLHSLSANEIPKDIIIRVGLTRNFAGVNCLTLTSAKEFRILDSSGECPASPVKALSKVETSLKDGLITLAINGNQIGTFKGPIRLEPEDSDQIFEVIQPAKVRNKYFRGTLIIYGGSELSVINEIDLEHYVYGVLPSEVPRSFSPESQKAFAIAARTYALRCMKRHFDAGFNLCDSTHCQTYCGASREAEWVRQAVDETKGLVISFDDKPIFATYMADCGGATMNSEDSGDGVVSFPYLRSVVDNPSGIPTPIKPPSADENNGVNNVCEAEPPAENITPKDYCSKSPHHLWTITYTIDELANKLSAWEGKIGKLKSIEFAEFDLSGHVKAVLLKGDKSECVIHGKELRNALGHDKLKSTRATLTISPEGKYIITGSGYGHGLGACMYGADQLGRLGKTAEEILKHYYTGVEIKPIWECKAWLEELPSLIIKDDKPAEN